MGEEDGCPLLSQSLISLHSISPSLSISLSLPHSLSLTLSPSLSFSLTLSPSLSFSLTLSLSLSLTLFLSLSLSLFLPHSLSLFCRGSWFAKREQKTRESYREDEVCACVLKMFFFPTLLYSQHTCSIKHRHWNETKYYSFHSCHVHAGPKSCPTKHKLKR